MGHARTSSLPCRRPGCEPLSTDEQAAARPFFFGTNLKMYQTPAETCALLDGLAPLFPRPGVQAFVLPSFTSLPDAARHPVREHVWLGAQTCHWADEGPYTGEISPRMLAALGLDMVLVGHAERRQGGETDETVNKKVLAALRNGLRVLLCVGETANRARGRRRSRDLCAATTARAARHSAERRRTVAGGIRAGLGNRRRWHACQHAAGRTGCRCTEAALIRALATESVPPLLYGGSVDANNAAAFAGGATFDGLFVGRAAWTPSGFASVLRAAEQARFGQ